MGVTSTTAVLPAALAGIKRQGGSLLVVGDSDGQCTVCKRLSGDSGEDRQHVVVHSDSDGQDCQWLPDTDSVVAIDASQESADSSASRAETIPPVRLSALSDEIAATVDRQAAAGLDPAELRVCLGSLDSLRETSDIERVALYLDSILDRVQRTNGMIHAHIDAAPESPPVRRLTPLFDAVIEASTDDEPRQRWHLTDRNRTSCWIPLKD